MISATRDSFQDMFDDDLTLEYEPVQTAAIILTGGDEEAEKAALEVRPRAAPYNLYPGAASQSCDPICMWNRTEFRLWFCFLAGL